MATSTDSDSTLVISALGRPLDLGTLYNALNDRIVPGTSLWSTEDMNKHTYVSAQPNTDVRVEASESLTEKTSLMDVSASVKASFLFGLVEVGGSAKYLKENTTSASQCRVTLKYSATTEHRELSITELTTFNPEVLNKTNATHVVVEVTYGADAFLEFEATASDDSNRQEIQGNLNVMIKKIPTIKISGEGSLNLNNEDEEKVKNFTCKFFGDFHVTELPTNYEEAVKVYKELPRLLVKNTDKAVPVKVWLYPLSKLTNTECKLKRMISNALVSQLEKVMDDFHQAEKRASYLLEKSKKIKAKDIISKLEEFQRNLRVFTAEFLKNTASMMPAIRGGNMEETTMTDVLKSKDVSGFSGRDMMQWLDAKETEINVVTMYIQKINDSEIKTEGTELNTFLLSPDVSDGFVLCFTSLKDEESYLNKSPPQENPKEEVPWYMRGDVMDALKTSISIFNSAPLKKRVISFISDPEYPGASIRRYHNTHVKSKNVTCIQELFACEFMLDKRTVHPDLILSEENKTVKNVQSQQSYDNNPERFDHSRQVLCAQPLPAGSSYWECEWSGGAVCIGVAYDTIHRKGAGAWVGGNDKSWSVYYHDNKYDYCHNDVYTQIANPPAGTRRVGVFVDREAGTLVYYSISDGAEGDTQGCTHRRREWVKFNISFTDKDLYAGIWVGPQCSVSLV